MPSACRPARCARAFRIPSTRAASAPLSAWSLVIGCYGGGIDSPRTWVSTAKKGHNAVRSLNNVQQRDRLPFVTSARGRSFRPPPLGVWVWRG